MKKPVVIIIFFIILLYGLGKLFSYFIFQNLNLKTSWVSRGKINADALILGPCVPLWMLDPDSIEKHTGLSAYNLSGTNSNLAENYAMLHLYLKHNRAPKYIFLYVNHESLDTAYNLFNTWQFMHIKDTLIRNIIKKEDPEYARWSFFPFIDYAWYNQHSLFVAMQGAKHFFTGREKPYHPNGFELPVYDSWVESGDKQGSSGKKYAIHKNFVDYLRKIIRISKAAGAEAVLYESPVFAAVKARYLNRNDIIFKIENIAKEESARFWSFDTLRFAGERKYYITPYNTTREGSGLFEKAFSEKIREELRLIRVD